jgi:hypothetical protein
VLTMPICTARSLAFALIIQMGGDFTKREARLAMVWSKMRVKDELTNRLKHTHLNFTDFLEALARASEMMTLPDDRDIKEAGCANVVEYFNSMESDVLQAMLEEAGTHYTDHYGKARPLAERLDKFFQLVFAAYDPDGDGIITTTDIIRFHHDH